MPSKITILSATDLTGAAAFAGIDQLKGAQLAVQEANDQGYLGSSKLDIQSEDTTTNPQTAASLASKAVADKSVAVVLGPTTGAEAAPMAAILQRAKLPVVYTQSGSDTGVLIGDYTYRVTALQTSYFYKGLAYLQQQKLTKMSIIYNSANETVVDLATKTIPDNAAKYGYTVGTKAAVTYTTQDFSGAVSKVLADKPDVVSVLVVGAANPTVVTQLRRAGYTGTILAQQGAGANQLKPAGSAAKGVVWTTDFTAASTDEPSAAAFTKAYQAKYGAAPTNFAAEGYDATWMIARAVKAAGSAQRDAIKTGLATVAGQGFDGAEGKLTFTSNDLKVSGILVGWNGSAEYLVK